jgi:hypothetical protein
MTIQYCRQVSTDEQPRLRIEHRVLVAPGSSSTEGRPRKLENLLDDFYAEHGPAWELVNVFKVGASDFIGSHQEVMFVFQKRTYQAVND